MYYVLHSTIIIHTFAMSTNKQYYHNECRQCKITDAQGYA